MNYPTAQGKGCITVLQGKRILRYFRNKAPQSCSYCENIGAPVNNALPYRKALLTGTSGTSPELRRW